MYRFLRNVQYHETDKMGVVHHSNYVKWMEEARISFLEDIGLPFSKIEEEGIASPVSGISIEYKRPCTFGDKIAIEIKIEKYTGVELEVSYEMTNALNGEITAEAISKHCFIKNGKICSLRKVNMYMHEIFKKEFDKDISVNKSKV